MDVIVTERVGRVLVCTLNRPQSANSITADVFAQLLEAWREADRDDAVRAVVTRAAGPNFSVGADASLLTDWSDKPLKDCFGQLYEGRQGLPGLGSAEALALDTLGMNRWAEAVTELSVPMIAQIRGVAAGGGLGLALLHHFRFADSTARFTTAFGKLGLGTELGVAYLLQTAIGRQASLDLTLTSRLVAAEEAQSLGLIDRLLAPEALDEATLGYADKIASLSRSSARAMIEAHRQPHRGLLRQSLELEWRQQQVLWASPEFRDGVARLEQSRARDKKNAEK